ncbi:MAG: GyrI-like domain-containing protein [Salegentibacter sp.]
MKIIKYVLFLLLILIIAGSIYVATKDGDYQIERTEVMKAPREVVFNEVNNYQTWGTWDPWAREADDMVMNFEEKTSGENSGYSWQSESMGDGSIHTVEATPFSSIHQKLSFETSFGKSTSDVYWNFEQISNDSTKVTWGMKGDQSFMEKLAFTLKDQSLTEMVQPMLEKGLNNLEEEISKKMEVYSINVDGVIQHGGGYYMYTTTASKISQVTQKMRKMKAEVSSYMEQNNIEKNGSAFVLYNEWNERSNNAIFSVGIFTPSEVITPAESEILTGFLPNQKVLKTTLKGDFDNLKEAWDKAYSYIQENELQVNEDGRPFEVHVTDPEKEPNPANWITQIYIPVKEQNPSPEL